MENDENDTCFSIGEELNAFAVSTSTMERSESMHDEVKRAFRKG